MIYAGILGLAVDDALGMPYKTGKRGSFDIYIDSWDSDADEYRMTGFKKGMPAYWYGEKCQSDAGRTIPR